MSNRNKIKLSDYIVKYIENLGVKHIFLISGGGNIHVVDSLGKSKKIQYICSHHEQAAAIAAEAYSRITDNIGVVLVTTGPGGTNAITGVYGAWTDSIPLLIISGQVKREMMGAGKVVRQLGDQEINIIDLVKPITKYAKTVINPLDCRYELDKAVHIAKSGRPGPVWLDIPLDIQGTQIEERKLKTFDPKEIKNNYRTNKKTIQDLTAKTIDKLEKARRPVLFIGNGVRLANAQKELLTLIKLLKIPVLTSFAGYDLVSTDNPYYLGRPGTVGQRAANFILQNCDLLLTVGTRLNIRTVGYNYQSFARNAYKIMVDIDKRELEKKTLKIDLAVNCDAKDFLYAMIEQLSSSENPPPRGSRSVTPPRCLYRTWLEQCKLWQKKYPQIPDSYWQQKKYVNPYCFIDILSKSLNNTSVLALSDGTACVVPYQTLKFPQGARIIVNSGCAAMGYGLPAAIGVCFANQKRKTICIEGDGSIQLNIQELQTVVYHQLPIKIFVFTNDGYLSIRLTQNSLFNGKYIASDTKSGVSCPDILKIARAYGIRSLQIDSHNKMKEKITEVLDGDDPVICEVKISPKQEFIPKVASRQLPDGSFVSGTLEDMYPFLSREEVKEIMNYE